MGHCVDTPLPRSYARLSTLEKGPEGLVRRMRTLGMLAVVGGLVTSGMALAQSPAPLPRPAPPALDKASDVPDSQKLERSTQALGGMRESLRQVFEKVEEARRTKDVVKLNCANEKLTQIKG